VRVGERVLELMSGKCVSETPRPIPLTASVGLGTLATPSFEGRDIPYPISQSYFQMVAQTLLLRADEALYQAKHEGGRRLCQTGTADWPAPTAVPSIAAVGE
jgi:GGDEF domain-containing protein